MGSPCRSDGSRVRSRDVSAFYHGRRVLVTGGLGFIGSNLARRLVELGADVAVLDSLIPDYGGNLFNIDGLESRVTLHVTDMRQAAAIPDVIRDREIIFNLAGQVSHIDSMRDPQTDLDINCRSQLTLLEACRQHNPAAKVVYAGTRQIYGRSTRRTSCGQPTSTASTRPRASTTIWCTTTCSASVRARCD